MSKIDTVIQKYNEILLRDLSFKNPHGWEDLILHILDTLGISQEEALDDIHLSVAFSNPGRNIVEHLLSKYTKVLNNIQIASLKETKQSTPYTDFIEYSIEVIKQSDIFMYLDSLYVYNHYDEIMDFMSPDNKRYLMISKLSGKKITL